MTPPDPRRPAVVALVATYRDGRLLAECVASAAPFVDAVVVLDGPYVGFDVDGPTSDAYELAAAVHAGALVYGGHGAWALPWRDELAKRNALLELGRAVLGPHANRWALVLDADEVLERGDRLRDYLERFGPLTGADWPEQGVPRRRAIVRDFAPGLVRVEPDGDPWAAPSRLFRLTDHVRYVERSYWLVDPFPPLAALDVVSLEHANATVIDERIPRVRHRWDERDRRRAELRHRYGRELAVRDHGR